MGTVNAMTNDKTCCLCGNSPDHGRATFSMLVFTYHPGRSHPGNYLITETVCLECLESCDRFSWRQERMEEEWFEQCLLQRTCGLPTRTL